VDIASSNLARSTISYTLIFFAGKVISDLKSWAGRSTEIRFSFKKKTLSKRNNIDYMIVKDRHLGMVEVPRGLFLFKEKRLRKRKNKGSGVRKTRRERKFPLGDALQEEEVIQRGNLRFPLVSASPPKFLKAI